MSKRPLRAAGLHPDHKLKVYPARGWPWMRGVGMGKAGGDARGPGIDRGQGGIAFAESGSSVSEMGGICGENPASWIELSADRTWTWN